MKLSDLERLLEGAAAGPWFSLPDSAGVVRFNNDPMTGMLIGRKAHVDLIITLRNIAPELVKVAKAAENEHQICKRSVCRTCAALRELDAKP